MLIDVHLKSLSFLWVDMATRFYEKYSWLLQKLWLSKWKLLSPEMMIQRASLTTFPHGTFSQFLLIFFLLGVCEQKWKPLTINPEHYRYEARLRLLQCWFAIFLIILFVCWQKTYDQLSSHNKREHLKLYHKILGLKIKFNLKYVWGGLFLLNLCIWHKMFD